MLKIENLCKKYKSGSEVTEALNNINIEFNDNGFVSILGPSGCGKTTLLNILGLLDTPDSGEIYLNNLRYSTLSESEKDELRNKKIGFIFQSYHLIPTLNVFDNVALPLVLTTRLSKEEINGKVETALKEVNLLDLKNKKSNELSGGQMQRIAIARALINEPEIILADEPTGALDSKNSIEVMKILKDISKDRLVIMVTHNMSLANEYSNRIVELSDGTIKKDTNKVLENYQLSTKIEKIDKYNKIASEKILWNLSFKNLGSKKLKTALTAIANCFGLVALGFMLSITNGFNKYQDKISYEAASNLPINVPAYTVVTEKENWKDINQTTEFPDTNEIYPYVKATNTYNYTYNNYTTEYFNLLDDFVEKGYASDYIVNYGNSFNYNLSTEFPASIDKKSNSYVAKVNTSLSAGGSYSATTYGIPTNIFHLLYGDINRSYDLIAGKMPSDKTELVLVVNEYNAINFTTLRALGFYNSKDNQKSIMNKNLETKVEPISFNDVLNKKYKIFSNDEVYEKTNDKEEVKDFFSGLFTSEKELAIYKENNMSDLYNSTNGIELKISGIIRPKKDSTLSLIAPSLCFLPELQDELVELKENSNISNDIYKNVIGECGEITDNKRNRFISEFTTYLKDYQDKKVEINSKTFNEIADKYFSFYYLEKSYHGVSGSNITNLRKTTFSNMFIYAEKYGAELIDPEIKKIGCSKDENEMAEFLKTVLRQFNSNKKGEQVKAYKNFIAIGAFLNSYTNITNVSIFATSIENRALMLKKLDEYNDSRTSEGDKIEYLEVSSSLIRNVEQMVGLVTLVLGLFIILLLIVACAMNVLFTYNSVLERTKDIGIIRAIGSKKSDVLRLFVIESGIIGFLSGVFSSIFTYILTFPINYLVNNTYPSYKMTELCSFSWKYIFILIIVGSVLAIVSSIIPSYAASKKDPVKCLKNE